MPGNGNRKETDHRVLYGKVGGRNEKESYRKNPIPGTETGQQRQDVKYIGVTALKIVGHEKHLLLEVYRNEKESMNIPVVRIAVTKKDFGTYRTDQDIWTREKIAQDYYYGATLVWIRQEDEQNEMPEQNPISLHRKKTCSVLKNSVGKMDGTKANGGSTYTSFRVLSCMRKEDGGKTESMKDGSRR